MSSDQSNGMSPMTDNYNDLNKSQSTAWEKVKVRGNPWKTAYEGGCESAGDKLFGS